VDPVALAVVRAIGPRRIATILAGLVVAAILFSLVVVPLLVGAVAGSAADGAPALTAACGPPATPGGAASADLEVPVGGTERWDRDQLGNATVIVQRGVAAKVGQRGVIIALATAMQESGLRNLDRGDRDSLGLFQQRPSTGWGSPAQIQDPTAAADAFYGVAGHTSNPGLLDITGWQSMPLTVAAQAVQRSGFPDAYARWGNEAGQLAGAILDGADLTQIACAGAGAIISGSWAHPLAPAAYTATSPFGMRAHPLTGVWRLHSGTDLAAPTGTPIRSACTGTVTQTGPMGSGGLTTTVDCGGGVEVFYMHQNAIGVRVGQQVRAGAAIGAVGNTGGSTGSHLHLGVRVGGAPTDPVPFFARQRIRI
jgi:hypothetical protein